MHLKKVKQDELKYYGIHACLFLCRHRPEDIIRLYLHTSNLKEFKPFLRYCAENKKAYHLVSNEELEKISGSVHHEGVCILAKPKKLVSEQLFFKNIESQIKPCCILFFDGVDNPHNIGSILRTCAHFGVRYVIGEKEKIAPLSPAGCRIAKGAAELVDFVAVEHLEKVFSQLQKNGFQLFATSSHTQSSLFSQPLPKKLIFIMGSEDKGVAPRLLSLCQRQVLIPGVDAVESLNVSVAAAVVVAEFFRQHGEEIC